MDGFIITVECLSNTACNWVGEYLTVCGNDDLSLPWDNKVCFFHLSANIPLSFLALIKNPSSLTIGVW
jgi:hypothetical protein